MFVQRLNADGVPEWVVFDDGEEQQPDADADGAAPPPTSSASTAIADALAGSLYADMLHDRPRAAAYAAALSAVVPRFQPPVLILDIGTGTGLLSILAARAAAVPDATVVACDQYPPMARLARQTVAAAGLSNRITVHACRSDELTVGGGGASLPRRADVVVSEILDSILLGEGALPTAADVGRRLLAPGGVAIPSRGRVWAQAVGCPALRACWDASGWASQAGGWAGRGSSCGLGDDPTPRPLHLDRLAEGGGDGGRLVPLGPPKVILDLDLTAPTAVEGRVAAAVPVAAAGGGAVDALAVWWGVDLTPEGDVTLDAAPGWVKPAARQPWIDHWKVCWVPVAAGAVSAGVEVEVEVSYGPTDLAVRAVPPPPASSSLAPCYAPSGLGLWATSLRAPALEAAAAAAVAAAADPASPPLRVIALGDGPLPALAALRAGATDVTAVVTSSPGAAAAVARVLVGTGAVVMAGPPPPPTTQPGLLLAEPHYRAAETRPLEALFRFRRDRQALADAGSLNPASTVLPSQARLVTVGVSTPDLARTAGPVRAVEGVGMAPFDAAMAAVGGDGRWLARSVGWQCGGYAEVTGRVGLGGDLDGGRLLAAAASTTATTLAGSAMLIPSGSCPASIDAIALWVEYRYGLADGDFEAGPTAPAGPTGGPAPGTQAVFLLPKPRAVPATGLAVTLTLDVAGDPALGGRMDVRAQVAVEESSV